jgi:SAM-dependent methyltransferase
MMRTVTTAEFWDNEAKTFDEKPDHGLLDPAIRAAWTELLLPLLPLPPARIADIGCGTGSLSLLLAGVGHRICGLDISPKMVDLAREKAKSAGHEADFSVGDASNPPWPKGSFDVVLTRHVLWAMDDPHLAVTNWLDLLDSDGRLILVEGRWWTGVGMSAADVSELVLRNRYEAEVTALENAALWGGPIEDERFVVVSRR